MGRYSYPHIIDNGAGERITFLRVVPGPKGDRLEVENIVTPGSGPPMHVHYFQDEAVTVLKGRIGYTRPEGPKQFGGPGDTVAFKAGEPHKFWNAGQDDLLGSGYIEPADNVEYSSHRTLRIDEAERRPAESLRCGVSHAAVSKRVRHVGDPRGGAAVCVPHPRDGREAARQVPAIRRRARARAPLRQHREP